MAKIVRPYRCMFCSELIDNRDLSWEHFVPQGLWDGKRPRHTVTLPAHKACNQSFAGDNEYFRNVLVCRSGIDSHPVAGRLLNGRVQRELARNKKKARRFFKNVRMANVRTPSGLYLGKVPIFDVEPAPIARVLRNIVRGIYYKATGRPLGTDVVVEVCGENDPPMRACANLIALMRDRWTGFGDGDDVFACRFVQDPRHADFIACQMVFYRRLLYFGVAFPQEFMDRDSLRRLIEQQERERAATNGKGDAL